MLTRILNLRDEQYQIAPLGGHVRAVDVVFEGTRSRIMERPRLIGRHEPFATYVNRDGATVYRWVFDRALTPEELPPLEVSYQREHVELASVEWFIAPHPPPLPPPIPIALKYNLIQNWFKKQRESIEKEHGKSTEECRMRFFFLEFDRTAEPAWLDATREGELSPSQIAIDKQCIDNVLTSLLDRFRHRVDPKHAVTAVFDPHEIERIATIFLDALKCLSDSGKDLPEPIRVRNAFVDFAAGDFRIKKSPHSNGYPNSAIYFLFAEFALVVLECGCSEAVYWEALLGPLITTQRIYAKAYGPPRSFNHFGLKRRFDVAQRMDMVKDWDGKRSKAEWAAEIDLTATAAFQHAW